MQSDIVLYPRNGDETPAQANLVGGDLINGRFQSKEQSK